MREGHVFIDHISFKIVRLVASLLKAGRIADLCMRLTGFLPGDEVGERDLSVDPLPLQMVPETGLVMALSTCDVTVARSLPGLDVGTHLVTEAAKGGRFRESQEGNGENKKNNNTKDE